MEPIKTGNLIAQARHEKSMTQKQLAELLHVTDRAVSKWERGLSFPDVSLLEPLSRALDLTITELLDGERIEQRGDEHTALAVSQLAAAALQKKTSKVRLLTAALCILALLLLGVGIYRAWNAPTHPASADTISYVPLSEEDRWLTKLSSGRSLKYRYTLTDDVTAIYLANEIWTEDGKYTGGRISLWRQDKDQTPLPYRGHMFFRVDDMPALFSDGQDRPHLKLNIMWPSVVNSWHGALYLPFEACGSLLAVQDESHSVIDGSLPMIVYQVKPEFETSLEEVNALEEYQQTAQPGEMPPIAEGGYTVVLRLEIEHRAQ